MLNPPIPKESEVLGEVQQIERACQRKVVFLFVLRGTVRNRENLLQSRSFSVDGDACRYRVLGPIPQLHPANEGSGSARDSRKSPRRTMKQWVWIDR